MGLHWDLDGALDADITPPHALAELSRQLNEASRLVVDKRVEDQAHLRSVESPVSGSEFDANNI